MARLPALLVKQATGYTKSDDGKFVLLGFTEQSGFANNLAIDQATLWNFLRCLVDATAAFPLSKELGIKQVSSFSTNWFEIAVGREADAGYFFVSFFRENGAHLTFKLERGMLERLVETSQAALGAARPVPSKEKKDLQ